MPTIKDLLKGPLSVPRSIEASLPKGAPQVSSVMESVRASLPEGPEIPAAAALPTAAPQLPQVPKVTEFIKSIEAGLPAGLPKMPTGGTPERGEIEEKGVKPQVGVATRGSL